MLWTVSLALHLVLDSLNVGINTKYFIEEAAVDCSLMSVPLVEQMKEGVRLIVFC